MRAPKKRLESSSAGVLKLSVIGGIMLDVVTYLPSCNLEELCEVKNVASTIKTVAGGTGVLFSIAAKRQGFQDVSLIGKVGSDPRDATKVDCAGQKILSELMRAGIVVSLSMDAQIATGLTMITYLSDGRRLLVSDPGADDRFSLQDITEEMELSVKHSDILFVSGYALLKPERASAAMRLMDRAKQNGRLVVVDIVPHSIFRMIDGATFRDMTRQADLVISEIGTANRLFDDRQTGLSSVSETASRILKHYGAVILQLEGGGHLMMDRIGLIEECPSDVQNLLPDQSRGYADGIVARLLHRQFDRLKRGQQR